MNPFPGDWAGMTSVFGADGSPDHSLFLKSIMAGGLRCVAEDRYWRILTRRISAAVCAEKIQTAQLKLRPARKAKRRE